MNAYEYIQKFKQSRAIPSDFAAAKELGISHPAIARMKAGGGMDNRVAAAIATELGIDLGEMIAELEAAKARTEEERQFWARFRRAAMISSVAILSALPHGENQAAISDLDNTSQQRLSIHYAQLLRPSPKPTASASAAICPT